MVNFCPKCGEYVEEDAEYCDNCGFDLRERKEKEKAQKLRDKKGKPLVSDSYGQYAEFFPRLIAWLIDVIITGWINNTIWRNVTFFDVKLAPFSFTWINRDLWNLSQLTGFLIPFLYWWILESYNNGRSIGKLILGIKTVDLDTLKTATPGNNAKNNLLKAAGILFYLDLVIGFFTNYGEPEKRVRIGQNWSKTVVIKVR